jgi:hypothetical protein
MPVRRQPVRAPVVQDRAPAPDIAVDKPERINIGDIPRHIADTKASADLTRLWNDQDLGRLEVDDPLNYRWLVKIFGMRKAELKNP